MISGKLLYVEPFQMDEDFTDRFYFSIINDKIK